MLGHTSALKIDILLRDTARAFKYMQDAKRVFSPVCPVPSELMSNEPATATLRRTAFPIPVRLRTDTKLHRFMESMNTILLPMGFALKAGKLVTVDGDMQSLSTLDGWFMVIVDLQRHPALSTVDVAPQPESDDSDSEPEIDTAIAGETAPLRKELTDDDIQPDEV